MTLLRRVRAREVLLPLLLFPMLIPLLVGAVESTSALLSGDVMEMHQLESVPLQVGGEVVFEPGGLHIMLIGLKRDLKLGDEFEITLQFRNHEEIQLGVPVQDTPASK